MGAMYNKGEEVTYRDTVWEHMARGAKQGVVERPKGVVHTTSDQYDEWVKIAWPTKLENVHKNHLIKWAFKHLG